MEANGIGYNIYVPGSVLGELPSVGSEVKIYTYMNVKEDECSLFGFLTRDDLSIFKCLSVSMVLALAQAMVHYLISQQMI